jgi:hypothetical protein
MAVVTGTYDTHTPVIGMREDLSDVIYNISPTETPFMMMIGRGTATATTHEWQIDALATADFINAQVEGDEAAFSVPTTTIRVSNFTQISRKTVIISGTTEQVDKAGRKSELAYQLAKYAKELKRDMESILIAGRATANAVPQMKLIGANTVAALLGPAELWFTTGDATATQPQNRTGTAPTESNFYEPTAVEVHGTQRAFKEADLKEVIREAWQEGGDPSVIMVGPLTSRRCRPSRAIRPGSIGRKTCGWSRRSTSTSATSANIGSYRTGSNGTDRR